MASTIPRSNQRHRSNLLLLLFMYITLDNWECVWECNSSPLRHSHFHSSTSRAAIERQWSMSEPPISVDRSPIASGGCTNQRAASRLQEKRKDAVTEARHILSLVCSVTVAESRRESSNLFGLSHAHLTPSQCSSHCAIIVTAQFNWNAHRFTD